MKKYRPHCAGYILLYVLVLLSAADAIYTLVCQLRGVANEMQTSFALFSYVICVIALIYTWVYVRSRVEIGDGKLRVAFPASIRPKPGAPRGSFIYRQGDTDLKLIDKTIPLKDIVRYGYVEDLGYERIDAGGAGETNPLFPVHEVAILTSDNKRYHMNAAIYSAKQKKAIFAQIQDLTGVAPEGKLAEVLK